VAGYSGKRLTTLAMRYYRDLLGQSRCHAWDRLQGLWGPKTKAKRLKPTLGGPSLDHLIRSRQHRRRDRQSEVLAVLRLITSSNFVGCSTGRSAGFAPFKMRSTNVAARWRLSSILAP